MKKQKNCKENGITLVALVITIIILLILAGVSIAALTESGLLKKARQAEQKSENAQIKEEATLGDYEVKIGEYIDGARDDDHVTREEYNSLLMEIEKLKGNSNVTGTYYETTFNDFLKTNLSKNTSNIVANITLPAGKYVLVGYARYVGSNLRYYIALGGAANSGYDNAGDVAMNVTSIVNSEEQNTYTFGIYPSKDITLKTGYIRAIKIGN